jgi:hypothetical protein
MVKRWSTGDGCALWQLFVGRRENREPSSEMTRRRASGRVCRLLTILTEPSVPRGKLRYETAWSGALSGNGTKPSVGRSKNAGSS